MSRFGTHVVNSAELVRKGDWFSRQSPTAPSGESHLSLGGPVAGAIDAPRRGKHKSEFLVVRPTDVQYFETQMELEHLGACVTMGGGFRRAAPPPPPHPPHTHTHTPNKIWRLTELSSDSPSLRMGCLCRSKSFRGFSHIPLPASFTRPLQLHIDSANRTRDCSAIGDPHRNVSRPVRCERSCSLE